MKLTGEQLRAARVRAGYSSIAAFAAEIGAAPRTVGAWERGEAEPQPRYRAAIDRALGAHPSTPDPDPLDQAVDAHADRRHLTLAEADDIALLTELIARRLRPGTGSQGSLPTQPRGFDDIPDPRHDREDPNPGDARNA